VGSHLPSRHQTQRIIGTDTYDLACDAENRVVKVKKNTTAVTTDVEMLIMVFQTDELPGDTAEKRFLAILAARISGPFQHFEGENLSDKENTTFANELRDDSHGQVGHFLTAARMGYTFGKYPGLKNILLNLVIGHEMVADAGGTSGFVRLFTHFKQYIKGLANPEAIRLFILAISADAASDYASREAYLMQILEMGTGALPRMGNTLADLILSVKGWRFGVMMALGLFETSEDAALWLKDNIYERN